MESFAKFEHEGWQCVAGKYDSALASLTPQFVPPLLEAVEVSDEMSVLDVGCGPGYVSAAAVPNGANAGREDFRRALAQAGFDGESMIFKLHSIYWNVPTAHFPFDAEHAAGVRTAGLLTRQTQATLLAIQCAIEELVRRYAKGDGFIPTAAYSSRRARRNE